MWRDGWYVLPYDVPYRDLDFFGHVNNATYFGYFENARIRLWLELTGGTKPEDINFIVAHAECDFRKQLRMEPIEICVRIGEMRTSSLDFLYEVRRGDDIAATGKVVVVLFDWKTNAKKAIDDDFRRKVAACAS